MAVTSEALGGGKSGFTQVVLAPWANISGAIQAAIDRAHARGEDNLVIQPGVYDLTAPLVLPDTFELCGPGKATFRTIGQNFKGVWLRAKAVGWTGDAVDDPMIDATNLGARVHGLVVDGNNVAAGGIKIGGQATKCNDNLVSQCNKYHIWVTNCNTGVTDANAGVIVEDNDIWGDQVAGTYGIVVENQFTSGTASAATDCWVIGNSISGCRVSGISAGFGAFGLDGSTHGLGGLMVKGNHVTCSTTNTAATCYLRGVVDFQVTGNTFDSVGDGQYALQLHNATAKGMVANNNIIGQSSGITTPVAAIGVTSGGTSDLQIVNNSIMGRQFAPDPYCFRSIVRFSAAPTRTIVSGNIGLQIESARIVTGSSETTLRAPSTGTYQAWGNFAYQNAGPPVVASRDGVRRYYTIAVQTAAYTITDNDDIIPCLHATVGFTVTLPTAVGRETRCFTIKNRGAAVVRVDGNGTETIDGASSMDLAQWQTITVCSNGTNWDAISQTGTPTRVP